MNFHVMCFNEKRFIVSKALEKNLVKQELISELATYIIHHIRQNSVTAVINKKHKLRNEEKFKVMVNMIVQIYALTP